MIVAICYNFTLKNKERIKEHVGYAKNNKFTFATGEHFNIPLKT